MKTQMDKQGRLKINATIKELRMILRRFLRAGTSSEKTLADSAIIDLTLLLDDNQTLVIEQDGGVKICQA